MCGSSCERPVHHVTRSAEVERNRRHNVAAPTPLPRCRATHTSTKETASRRARPFAKRSASLPGIVLFCLGSSGRCAIMPRAHHGSHLALLVIRQTYHAPIHADTACSQVASLDVATVAQRVVSVHRRAGAVSTRRRRCDPPTARRCSPIYTSLFWPQQARAVALGEAPSPLAKREGRLLRFVFPEEARLGTARLAQHLQVRWCAPTLRPPGRSTAVRHRLRQALRGDRTLWSGGSGSAARCSSPSGPARPCAGSQRGTSSTPPGRSPTSGPGARDRHSRCARVLPLRAGPLAAASCATFVHRQCVHNGGAAGPTSQDARQAVAHGGGAATGAPAQAAQGPVGALAHALYARSLLASHAVRIIFATHSTTPTSRAWLSCWSGASSLGLIASSTRAGDGGTHGAGEGARLRCPCPLCFCPALQAGGGLRPDCGGPACYPARAGLSFVPPDDGI